LFTNTVRAKGKKGDLGETHKGTKGAKKKGA